MFWAATALSRIQVLVLEALLAGVVSAEGPVDISVEDHDMRVAGLALEDLNGLLRRLGRLYGIEAPELRQTRSEEHTSELQSLLRISYAVFCLKKKKQTKYTNNTNTRLKTTTCTKKSKQH